MKNGLWAFALIFFAELLLLAWVTAPERAQALDSKCGRGIFANTSGISDGCSAAPSGTPDNKTLIQHPDFFDGYANQSGQRYKTRPPWNVAGVDYPVGIPASTVLKDPAVAKLPGGCTYSSDGNSLGGPAIRCSAAGKDLIFDGLDFSGKIAGNHGCVVFGPGDPQPKSITIKNSYFGLNSGCFGKSNSGYPVQLFIGTSSLDFENNVVDYGPPRVGVGSGFIPISVGNSPSLTFKYNAFINIPQNPINGSFCCGRLLMEYNYVDNYVFDVSNQNHAEVTDLNGSGIRQQYYWFFNTILRGNNVGVGSGTANIWLSAVFKGGFADARVLNNVTVDNCSTAATRGQLCQRGEGEGYATMQSALVNLNSTQFATVIRDNYVDAYGSLYYSLVGGATCAIPIDWQGNYELRGGKVVSKEVGLSNVGKSGC